MCGNLSIWPIVCTLKTGKLQIIFEDECTTYLIVLCSQDPTVRTDNCFHGHKLLNKLVILHFWSKLSYYGENRTIFVVFWNVSMLAESRSRQMIVFKVFRVWFDANADSKICELVEIPKYRSCALKSRSS